MNKWPSQREVKAATKRLMIGDYERPSEVDPEGQVGVMESLSGYGGIQMQCVTLGLLQDSLRPPIDML